MMLLSEKGDLRIYLESVLYFVAKAFATFKLFFRISQNLLWYEG